jgi:hypothetical protein
MEIQSGMKENGIFTIPVRLEKCLLPNNLKQWHVDWFIEEQRPKLFNALEEGKKRRRRKSKKMKPLIFLSYSRNDQDVVKAAYKELRKKGYSPWMDQFDIVPGEKWERAIQRTIEKADFFLVFLSEHSVNRRGVLQQEIRMALSEWNKMLSDDIYLIPVRLTNCPIPEDLSSFQCVDLFEDSGWSNLLKAIASGLKRRCNDPRNKR